MQTETLNSNSAELREGSALRPEPAVSSKAKKYFYFFIAASFLVLFFLGSTSKPFLGDEIHHYRFAKDSFLVNGRAAFDAVYGSPNPPGFLYSTDPAWPLALSWIWKLMGRISFPAAQFFHTCFYSLLLMSVYGIGKKFYGEKEGIGAAILVGTVPMILSFSILFYIDIPSMALLCASLFFLLEKRYLRAGLFLALAVLAKRSMVFFLPAFGLIFILDNRKSIWQFIWRGFLYGIPSVLAVGADIIWRRKNLYPYQAWDVSPYDPAPAEVETAMQRIQSFVPSIGKIITERSSLLIHNFSRIVKANEYTNSFLLDPRDVFKYFGVALLFMLAGSLFIKEKTKQSRLLWFCIVSYFICFTIIFNFGTDIRYLMPVTPFAAILASQYFKKMRGRAGMILFVLTLSAQVFGTLAYVYYMRRPTPALMEGFAYLKKNVPEHAVILYPEANLIEYAERPMIWSAGGASRLFWTNDVETVAILDQFGIDYILVKKTRTYDDRKTSLRHVGGYPQSFLERLPKFPFVEGPLFENSELSLWKTKHVVPASSRLVMKPS